MPYDAQIPQPNDLLNESQGEFLNNFQAIAALFAVNHYPFGDAKEGKHKFCTFPQQPQPQPMDFATQVQLKSALNGRTNRPELLYYNNTNRAGKYLTSRLTPVAGGTNPQWAALGGNGLQMKWGLATATGFATFQFPENPNEQDFVNPPFCVLLTPYPRNNANADVWVRLAGGAPTITTFNVYCSQRSNPNVPTEVTFLYLAIGI